MASPFDRLSPALEGRYRFEGEIGSGGMAVVYLAQDLKHDRRVAIKVLRPELAFELGVDRFLREIRVAAGLSHPNILPLFDSGEADGLLYFVMPYVEGETLRHRLLREGKLSLEETVRLVREVGGALARAHEAGVVHRDVKPENILLESGHALVSDFGVAHAVDAAGGERLTRTGVAVGTPAYMSPEQVTNDGSVDGRSDVYALGCLAYEMLTGEPPFAASSPAALAAAHLAREAPSVAERGVTVPDGVERALGRALAKEPAERFASATDMVEAMSVAVTAEAVRVDERRRSVRRWGFRAAALTGMAMFGIGGWWLTDVLSAPAIERLAVLPASNLTRDPAQDPFVDGVHEALVTELQRAGIAIVARQSVLRYRASDLPIDRIARELGVDALIQPTVAWERDSVVVHVSLYDGRTQVPIWADSFGAQLAGVLALYRDVSRRVAEEIGVVLSEGAAARLAERPRVDPQVVEAVFSGQFHLRRFNPRDFDLALGYFSRALELDSLHAPAHLGVASVWGYRAQGGLIPPAEAEPYIVRHLERALALDPDLARARFLEAAKTVWADWDAEAGLGAMDRVLELDPNDAEHQVFYAHVLMILGRFEEAVRRGELAVQLDPLNPFVQGLHGVILNTTGRTAEAVALVSDVLEKNPGAAFGRGALWRALEAEGRYEEALEQRLIWHARRPAVRAAMEAGYRDGGYREAMRRSANALATEAREGFASGMEVAGDYAAAGDAEAAIDWIEVAVAQRDPNLPYLGVNPAFRSLHDQPRFQAVLREIGVEAFRP